MRAGRSQRDSGPPDHRRPSRLSSVSTKNLTDSGSGRNAVENSSQDAAVRISVRVGTIRLRRTGYRTGCAMLQAAPMQTNSL